MKKLFLVLTVASLGFVACNNEGETKSTTDSTAISVDTTVVTPPVVDTMVPPVVDTTKKDSTAK